jgi:hypothetical protein
VSNVRGALAELFGAAGSAHHHAFAATNGDDPDWPVWYADYLAPRLSALLGRPLQSRMLAADLRTVDAEHRAQAPKADWTEFYADWFLAKGPR